MEKFLLYGSRTCSRTAGDIAATKLLIIMIFTKLAIKKVGLYSVVSIATRYGLDSAGIESWL